MEFSTTVDQSAKNHDAIPGSIENADEETSVCRVNEPTICHEGNEIQDGVSNCYSPIVKDASDYLEKSKFPNDSSMHSDHKCHAGIVDNGAANAYCQLSTPRPDINNPLQHQNESMATSNLYNLKHHFGFLSSWIFKDTLI